jgi:hypothetical protein
MKKLSIFCLLFLSAALCCSAFAGTLAFWEFNEQMPGTPTVMGQRIVDSSGNGRDLYVALGTEGATTFVEPNPHYGDGSAMGFTADNNRLFFEPGYDFGDGGAVAGSQINFGVWDSFTMETLVRFPTRNDDSNLFCAPLGVIDPETGTQIWWRVRDNNNLQFLVMDDVGVQNSFNVVPGTAAPGGGTVPNLYDGNWHHWAVVRDTATSQYHMYVDHILVASIADSTGTITLSVPWGIGGWGPGYDNRNFVGSMDFLRISDEALTPEGFIQSTPYAAEPTPANGSYDLPTSLVDLSWVPASGDGVSVSSQSVKVASDADMSDIIAVETASENSVSISGLEASNTYYWLVETDGTIDGEAFSSKSDVWSFATVDAVTPLAAYWQFDDGDPGSDILPGDQLVDMSGNSRDLLVILQDEPDIGGAVFGNPDAYYGSSASFEGYSDNQLTVTESKISVGENENLTIEAVIKFSINESSLNAILATVMSEESNYWYGVNQPQYWFRTEADGNLRFWVQDTQGNSNSVRGSSNIYDGQWHHVAAVRDASAGKIRLYLDYELEAEEDDVTGDINPSGSPTVAGIEGYTSRNFEGNIDFVKVTRTALEPAEFEQPVGVPSDPDPFDQAVDVPVNYTYSWTPIPDASITSETLIISEDPYMRDPSAQIAASGSSALVEDLKFNTTYYWQVETTGSDSGGSFTRLGPVWSFTTPSCSVDVYDGDLSKDCVVNFDDLAILAGNWLLSGL